MIIVDGNMSFEQLEKIFYERFPNGNIWKEDKKINVAFAEKGKVYSYSYRKNFVDVARKIFKGEKIAYREEIEKAKKEIEKIEKILENGYDDFLEEALSEGQIANYKDQIYVYQKIIEGVL